MKGTLLSIANDNRFRQEPRVFLEFRPPMRSLIEDAIESLMLLLDEIDGDADFEEEPDEEDGFDQEQDLGGTHAIDQTNAYRSDAFSDGTAEFEGDTVAESDVEDDELEKDPAEDGIADADGVAEQIGCWAGAVL
ncbi:hypothetical protein [Methylocystis parvus]|uniref:hypothetical protein n=1 Tax=Methylocystis parvus TaxID=134 RepID=UPI003C775468